MPWRPPATVTTTVAEPMVVPPPFVLPRQSMNHEVRTDAVARREKGGDAVARREKGGDMLYAMAMK